VVHHENQRAIRFYQSLGYGEAGTQFHDFEDIRMEFKVLEKRLG
jgi:ribosomal protein S18 acetylase RimI-like enzyme